MGHTIGIGVWGLRNGERHSLHLGRLGTAPFGNNVDRVFLTGLAEALAYRWCVRVVCSQPTYSQHGVLAPNREVRNGTTITHCFPTHFSKDHLPGRLVNLITASVSMGWNTRRDDVVLVVTNPPLLPFLSALAVQLRAAAGEAARRKYVIQFDPVRASERTMEL